MYDPEAAEKLLDEAGYQRGADGIRFKTSHMIHPAGNSLDFTEIVASYWAEIGVDVEIDVAISAEWTERLRTYEGIVSGISGTIYDPLMVVGWYHSDTHNMNRPRSEWPELDAMVEAAQAATTTEEMQRLIAEADMYAMENHWLGWTPKLPVWWLLQPWVIGYSGEAMYLAPNEANGILARLWIDSDLKEAMGH